MNHAAIIDALNDELAPDEDEPDDDGILVIADVPPFAPEEALLVDDDGSSTEGEDTTAKDSDDDDDTSDDEASDSDSDDDNDDGDAARMADDAAALAAGLRRSGRGNKGRTDRYANYTFLLHAWKAARGGPKRATLRDGVMMFSADDISDSKPIPEVEDRLEYAFGVILQQYSIGTGLKKFKERGEAWTTKELA